MYIDELNHRFSTYSLKNKAKVAQSENPNILAQKRARLARTGKLRWLLAISTIPLLGIYTAFGLAPKPEQTASETLTELTQTIAFTPHTEQKDNAFIFSDRVKASDSLKSILSRLHIQDNKAAHFFRKNALSLSNQQRLKTGQTLKATVNQEGQLHRLDFQFDPQQSIVINQSSENKLVAKKVELPIEMRKVFKSATITHSLFASTDAADIPDRIALQLVKLFESDVDFHREIQKGDNFKLIYEAGFHNGKQVKSGDILAVSFTNKRKTYTAIGFKNNKGEMQYFTPKGNSLGKTFLRSPLEFTRITSGFSRGRYHPILQRIRAHKGVDMAAPTGTKIRAAGDAVVAFSGWKGGYGRVVILKHARGIKTVYGHLSKFAKNLKKGKSIKQGQVIGYVGKSGMATGPHLHYEFLKNGKHQDPMKVALPKTTHISKSAKARFLHHSKLMQSDLQILNNTNIAALR